MLSVRAFVQRSDAYDRRIRRLSARLRVAQARARANLNLRNTERVCSLTSELYRAVEERRTFLRAVMRAVSRQHETNPALH